MAHPGGNVTRLLPTENEIVGKRLELLKEIAPRGPAGGVHVDPGFVREAARLFPGRRRRARGAQHGIARDRDFADQAIDLGIALEALLLHELGKEDRGELRYRLSLRGAWLGGGDEQERAEIQRTLKAVYDLRSRAVHAGT